MSSHLLTCPECSDSLTVTLAQAGERVICQRCKTSVDVPTMRELKALPAGETVGEKSIDNGWNVLRGSLFVAGVLAIGFATFAHLRLEPQRKRLDTAKPKFEEISISLERLTLEDAWNAWNRFRVEQLDYRDTPQFIENRKKHQELSYSLYIAWTAGGIGFAMIATSIAWPLLQGLTRRTASTNIAK